MDLNEENDFFVTTLEEEGFSLSKENFSLSKEEDVLSSKEEDADSIKQMI